MIPIAGSAYTYGYATLGEIFAWIIGWDLILEYAFGATTVASGWSSTSSNSCRFRHQDAALAAMTTGRPSAGAELWARQWASAGSLLVAANAAVHE